MDAIVEAALRKWPHVPHCYDWLALDARGDWFLRDQQAQANGPFPQSKGSRIEHAGLRAFIERNYAHDDAGCWFFQNGPQRVYVELELAPWVWRLAESDSLVRIESHTGVATTFESAWVDERGHLFVAAPLGLGVVHTQDMHLAARAVERGTWTVTEISWAALVTRFGPVLSPAALREAKPR
jgi:Protein of unknown function (DUF2946)